MRSAARLRGDVERDRPRDAVQREVARGGAVICSPSAGAVPELDRRRQRERRLRELGGLHDVAAELAVAAVVVALDRRHVDGEGRRLDRRAGDRHVAVIWLLRPPAVGVDAEQHLLDPVAELGFLGDCPGAVVRPPSVAAAEAGAGAADGRRHVGAAVGGAVATVTPAPRRRGGDPRRRRRGPGASSSGASSLITLTYKRMAPKNSTTVIGTAISACFTQTFMARHRCRQHPRRQGPRRRVRRNGAFPPAPRARPPIVRVRKRP